MNRRRVAVATLAALLVGVAWWWPQLTNRSPRLNILVTGGGQYAQSHDVIERRLREIGYSVRWLEASTWCDAAAKLPAELATARPERIAASFVAMGGCDNGVQAFLDSAGSIPVLVQFQPREQAEVRAATSALRSRYTAVDGTAWMLPEGATTLPCQWWDDCEPGGTVQVRAADGTLTVAGAQRVARSLVAVLP